MSTEVTPAMGKPVSSPEARHVVHGSGEWGWRTWSHALVAERLTALATPAARLLLLASMAMAAISVSANLSVVDDLTADSEGTLRQTMHASTVATLIFSMVAGVYSATTDLRFGLVDQRTLSQPNRRILLGAKALGTSAVGLLYGMLGSITAVGVGVSYFFIRGESFDLGSPIVARALLGLLVGAPLFAALGVGVGTLIRNQPVAMGATLAWMLIFEPAAILGLPSVARWLPGAAGLAVTYTPDEALLSQVGGGLWLATLVVASLIAAAFRFERSDL